MTWLVWRQHRIQFLVGAALLAAFAVLIVITGVQVADQYHTAQAACAAGHGCQHPGGLFLGSHAVGFLIISTLGAPALVGLFVGAPLVAAEAEAGTTQFAWMQSVTRKRWLTVKIGWMLLAAAVWGGVISALVTWWEGPNNAEQLDMFDPGRFDIMGTVPVAYSLFAVALGIAAGTLLRRTLPAIAVTLAGFIAVRALITLLLRPHYMSAVTVYYKVTSGFTPAGSFWQLAQGVVGPNGQQLAQPNNTNYHRRRSRQLPPEVPAPRCPGVPSLPRRRARRRCPTSAHSSPTSPLTATGRSRASRPASSWSWPPPSSRSPR